MPRQPSSLPTPAELEILQVLWHRGPATVRQIFTAVKDRRGTRYSTTLKIVQVMTARKRLLIRDDTARPQLYRPAHPQAQTQLALLDNLIQSAFANSPADLIALAARTGRITPLQLSRLQRKISIEKTHRDRT